MYLVVACPAGYGSNDDISGCIECPEGTYSDSIGDEKCMTCPTNFTTIGTRSNRCIGKLNISLLKASAITCEKTKF